MMSEEKELTSRKKKCQRGGVPAEHCQAAGRAEAAAEHHEGNSVT